MEYIIKFTSMKGVLVNTANLHLSMVSESVATCEGSFNRQRSKDREAVSRAKMCVTGETREQWAGARMCFSSMSGNRRDIRSFDTIF